MTDDKTGQEAPDEQEDFFLGGEQKNADDQESAEPPPGLELEAVPEKRRGATRLLLMLLLLIAVAGAGFYFYEGVMLGTDEPVVAERSAKPSKMKIPERPRPAASRENVKEEVVPKERVAAVKQATEPKVSKVVVAPKPKPKPQPAPAYALTSGSYLYRGSLKKAKAQIEKLGYKVSLSEKPEAHEMTRLFVGQFTKPLAEKRLSEVKKLSDGAFLAAEGGQYAVYAGSFLSLDKARRAADLLYQKGIRVEERKVTIDLPQTTLRFGGFVTRAEAESVSRTLKKNGVKEPKIVPYQ